MRIRLTDTGVIRIIAGGAIRVTPLAQGGWPVGSLNLIPTPLADQLKLAPTPLADQIGLKLL